MVDASGAWGADVADLDLELALTDFRLPALIAGSLDPTLREIMQDPDPLDVQVVAGLERRGPRYTGHLESDFLLPGADHFRAWLPRISPTRNSNPWKEKSQSPGILKPPGPGPPCAWTSGPVPGWKRA